MVKFLCHKSLDMKFTGMEFIAGHYYEMELDPHGYTYIHSSGCNFTVEADEDGLSYRSWFTQDLELDVDTEGNAVQEETVTISKADYEELLHEVEFLNCLRASGVDNWEGYSDAGQMMEEEEE